jgi:hypothetical protein
MADQAFRCRKEIIKADAESNLLDYFVGVLRIDVVFNRLSSIFSEIFWGDLDKVRDLGLGNIRFESLLGRGRLKTHENEHDLALRVQ